MTVILGMHRSGTSLLARGIAALGFALGDRLLPPRVPDNPTGYWEDADFVAFDDELLKATGSGWSRPGVDLDALAGLARDEAWAGRAASLLSDRLSAHPAFAVKDPRMSRLLGFWRPIFRRCGAEASYVLSVRNPLEIARSLSRRDPPVNAATAYVLTAEHLFVPLLELRGDTILVVEYEAFLRGPQEVLRRLAGHLGIDPAMAAGPEADAFCTAFVLPEGRHEKAAPDEFEADPLAPRALAELSRTLAAAHAQRYRIPANVGARGPFAAWEGMAYGLWYGARAAERRPTRDRDEPQRRITELERALALAGDHAANLERARAASDAALEHARRHARDLERKIGDVEKERDLTAGHVANLERARAASDAALEHVRRHARDLERKIGDVEKERDLTAGHAANLERARAASDTALDHARVHARDLERKVAEVERERSLAADHAANLERALAASDTALEHARDRIRDLERRIGELEAERTLTQTHVVNLEALVASSRGSVEDMGRRVTELETTLLARDAEIGQAAVNARALAAEISSLRAELARFWWLPRRRAARSS